MSKPVAENLAISRESVVDSGQENGVMTINLKHPEPANFRVACGSTFSTPSVTAAQPDDAKAMQFEGEAKAEATESEAQCIQGVYSTE